MSSFDKKDNEPRGEEEVLSPGIRLRRAREACELSLERVAGHLKLSVDKIKCLERGEVESIAAPVFVAGYLRSYARLVHLSGDEVVADFKALTAMELPSMDPASSPAANDFGQVDRASSLNMSLGGRKGLGVALIAGVVIVLLVVGVYVYLSNSSEISNVISNVKEIDSSSPARTEFVENLPSGVSQNEAPQNEAPQNEVPQNGEAAVNEVSEGSVLIPLASSTNEQSEMVVEESSKAAIPAPFAAPIKNTGEAPVQSESAVSKVNSSELTLYFTEDSWADVSDSQNKRLLYRLVKAGMSHTVTGLPPFNVRLGFVNGVSIMFNGDPYDLSRFANRKSARFFVGEKENE